MTGVVFYQRFYNGRLEESEMLGFLNANISGVRRYLYLQHRMAFGVGDHRTDSGGRLVRISSRGLLPMR